MAYNNYPSGINTNQFPPEYMQPNPTVSQMGQNYNVNWVNSGMHQSAPQQFVPAQNMPFPGQVFPSQVFPSGPAFNMNASANNVSSNQKFVLVDQLNQTKNNVKENAIRSGLQPIFLRTDFSQTLDAETYNYFNSLAAQLDQSFRKRYTPPPGMSSLPERSFKEVIAYYLFGKYLRLSSFDMNGEVKQAVDELEKNRPKGLARLAHLAVGQSGAPVIPSARNNASTAGINNDNSPTASAYNPLVPPPENSSSHSSPPSSAYNSLVPPPHPSPSASASAQNTDASGGVQADGSYRLTQNGITISMSKEAYKNLNRNKLIQQYGSERQIPKDLRKKYKLDE